jgi:hypothetical protein
LDIIKTCGCCGARHTAAGWQALKQLGTQPTETEDGRPATLVLANCDCGSTLALEVTP